MKKKDIEKMYPEQRRLADLQQNNKLIVLWRYISFPLTSIFLFLDFSANNVSFLSLLVGLTGCIFFALGSYLSSILGGVCLWLWMILDYVDGNIARYNNNESKTGHYLDAQNEFLVLHIYFVAIGYGLSKMSPDSWLLNQITDLFRFSISDNLFLIIGFIASFCSLMRKNLVCMGKWIFVSTDFGIYDTPKDTRRNLLQTFAFLFNQAEYWLRPLLLIIAALFRLLPEYLIFLCLKYAMGLFLLLSGTPSNISTITKGSIDSGGIN